MHPEAVIAQPVPRKACAISSYLSTAMVAAHVLLVLRFRRGIPLSIPEAFCMWRRSHQLMNRCDIDLVLPFRLRHNPAVHYHLPRQSHARSVGHPARVPFPKVKYRRQRKAFTSMMARMNENTGVSHRCVIQLSSIEGSAWRRLL
jgi:hypothetical protein